MCERGEDKLWQVNFQLYSICSQVHVVVNKPEILPCLWIGPLESVNKESGKKKTV